MFSRLGKKSVIRSQQHISLGGFSAGQMQAVIGAEANTEQLPPAFPLQSPQPYVVGSRR